MSTFEELAEALRPLAEQTSALYDEAARRYEPVVDAIVRGNCRDAKRIEHTLDGLLDFGDYWTVDKVATAEYVMLYRDHWDSAATVETEATA